MSDLSARPLRLSESDRRLYVDRHAEVDAMTRSLRHGGNVLLLGNRGVGKTSLLHHVAGALEAESLNVAIVSGRITDSAAEVLSLVRDQATQWPRPGSMPTAEDRQEQMQLALSRDPSPARVLLDEVELLRRELLGRSPGAVFIDEVAAAVPPVLFGRLRDELWELSVSWCVAADVDERAAYVSPPADAFWTRVIELGPLDRDSGLELLRRRTSGEIAASEAARLVDIAEGNPRRILQLARELVSGEQPVVIERDALDREQRRETLSSSARRLLDELEATGPTGPSDPALLAKLGWTRGRASQVFGELVQAGLVRESTLRGPVGRPRKLFEALT